MTAIGYCRVSTEEQVIGGISLDAQKERIGAYCALHGLTLIGIVSDEGVSGSKPLLSRPAGKELSKVLSEGKATHVIALKLDRLFRNAVDALQTVGEWEKKGITLHLIDMGGQSINTTTATGKLFLTMLAGFAEFERNVIAERTTLALKFKRTKKQVYGTIPLGFRRENNNLVPDDWEMGIVKLIFALHRQGFGRRRIVDELRRRGLRTKKNRSWHTSTVAHILKNEALYRDWLADLTQ